MTGEKAESETLALYTKVYWYIRSVPTNVFAIKYTRHVGN